jgi:hypothetical protein
MENSMFDYLSFGKKLDVPLNTVKKFEKEAHREFPFDTMLMEIHIIRALKAYARRTIPETVVKN